MTLLRSNLPHAPASAFLRMGASALLACLFTCDALATTAKAGIQGLAFEVTDLDLDDGVQAGYTVSHGDDTPWGSPGQANVSAALAWWPSNGAYDADQQPRFMAGLSAQAANPNANASATVSGWDLLAQLAMDDTPHLYASGFIQTHIDVLLQDPPTGLILAPNTQVVIQGTAILDIDRSTPNSFEVTASAHYDNAVGSGSFVRSLSGHYLDWGNEEGRAISQALPFSFVLTNRSSDPLPTALSFSVGAWASNSPSPVPEPGEWLLTLSGVALLAAWRGRERTKAL